MTMETEPMFDFGGALERLRAGKSVRRRVWPNPGMALVLRPLGPDHPSVMVLLDGVRIADVWQAAQVDLLATDWETVKPADFEKRYVAALRGRL